MDADKPCRCPRCGWLGTIHDAEAYQPLAHLEPLNICPRCATETEVQPLGQKGLDALYREYALLLKPGYQHEGERAERRAQLERFFEHIDHPPRSTSGPNLYESFKIIEYPENGSPDPWAHLRGLTPEEIQRLPDDQRAPRFAPGQQRLEV